MSKIDVGKIVKEMQNLYAKDKKISDIVCTGDSVKTSYEKKDVVLLKEGHPLQTLIGLPGIPYNKIIQVVGKPDCGKSTWAAEIMTQAQNNGIQVILWDSEDKYDANRHTLLGGKPEDILLIKTNEILKGGELIRRYVTAVKEQDETIKILLVWDSVGGSQSRSHAERELDSEKHAQPGQDAKENGSVMKMIVSLINKYPDSIAMYMANQSYAKIGFMQKGDAASGGTKIEYHSSLIIFLKRIKTLTHTIKGNIVKKGIISRATVTKNHLSTGETSVHQLDFTVNAFGSVVADFVEDEDENT